MVLVTVPAVSCTVALRLSGVSFFVQLIVMVWVPEAPLAGDTVHQVAAASTTLALQLAFTVNDTVDAPPSSENDGVTFSVAGMVIDTAGCGGCGG